jgi:hypothetical protein
MNFLKKHYEKIILAVVLLAVAGVSFGMLFYVRNKRETLDAQLTEKVRGKQKELKPVDLATATAALARLTNSATVELAGEHNTFNPLYWMYDKNKNLVPVRDRSALVGLKVDRIIPLNLSITLSATAGTGEPYRYQFIIGQEYEKQKAKRGPTTTSLQVGSKNDIFILRDVSGPKDNATGATIQLIRGAEEVALSLNKPFTKQIAWAADLSYSEVPGDNGKPMNGKRADDSLVIRGITYKIVAITKDEVVISSPNQVRTTIKCSTP